jgi:hypothetical protein
MANDIGTAVPCPVIPQKASNQRKNQKYELGKYDEGRRWRWLDALRKANHGMSLGEGYLLMELVRRAGDGWTNQPYQRRVLANHDLDHVGVFVSWPSTATLAEEFGCSEKHVRNLSKRLQDRGYLTVLTNAGGTGERARTDRPNLYVVDARSLPTGLVHRVEPEVREGAPMGAPGWNQRCAGVEPEVHQIVSEDSVNTNSLNVAENGQREMASVKADEMPEQMTLELTTAIRAICPQDDLRTAQSNARSLASLGATPDLVRQFPSWWASTGKTYTYGSAAIVKWWTAFASAHLTDSHKPTASTATARPLCGHCVGGWIPVEEGAPQRCLCAGGKPLTDTEPAGQPSATLEEPVSLEEQTANTQTIRALANQIKTGRQ